MLLSKKPLFAVSLLLASFIGSPAVAQPANTFTQVTDNIYRGSNGIWNSLIQVGEDAILLVDTLNPDYAQWLKGELDSRFPGKPVKYVIYSHSHFDHVEGGKVFADTATFIAQSRMLQNMDGRFPHMPGDMTDRNNNGTFEPEEFQIPWDASPGICGMPVSWLSEHDLDHDGHMTPAEYFAGIVRPDITYERSMTLEFDGQTLTLLHPGRNHGNDMTVVLFPRQKLLFAVDFISDAMVRNDMHSLPSACGPFDGHPLQEWIDSYLKVEALDFEVLATGHGGNPVSFHKQDVVDTRVYFEYLRDAVSAAMAQGMSLDEMKASLKLEEYKDWALYDRLRMNNIEAAYYNLKQFMP